MAQLRSTKIAKQLEVHNAANTERTTITDREIKTGTLNASESLFINDGKAKIDNTGAITATSINVETVAGSTVRASNVKADSVIADRIWAYRKLSDDNIINKQVISVDDAGNSQITADSMKIANATVTSTLTSGTIKMPDSNELKIQNADSADVASIDADGKITAGGLRIKNGSDIVASIDADGNVTANDVNATNLTVDQTATANDVKAKNSVIAGNSVYVNSESLDGKEMKVYDYDGYR